MEPVNIKAQSAVLGAMASATNATGMTGFFELFIPLIMNILPLLCLGQQNKPANQVLKEAQNSDGSFPEQMVRRSRVKARVAARHNDEDRHDNATGQLMSPKQWQAELDRRVSLAYQRTIDEGETALAACAVEAAEIPDLE